MWKQMNILFGIISFMLISIIPFSEHYGFTAGACGDPSTLPANDSLMHLSIPARRLKAIGGLEFAEQVIDLDLEDREKAISKEILSGNVPSFSRKLRPIKINLSLDSTPGELIFYATCDYMAIGSDQDYLYIPMTPSTAQYIADQTNCLLPTKKMVDLIYSQAEIKLKPQPITPSDLMTTVQVFRQHIDSIEHQMAQIGFKRSGHSIIAGHKKDIIISNKIYSQDRNFDRVVIYGWHLKDHHPIQPVYNGHTAKYVDYSHGIRLVSNVAFLNGDSVRVAEILRDAHLSSLVSDEGIISKPYYSKSRLP